MTVGVWEEAIAKLVEVKLDSLLRHGRRTQYNMKCGYQFRGRALEKRDEISLASRRKRGNGNGMAG